LFLCRLFGGSVSVRSASGREIGRYNRDAGQAGVYVTAAAGATQGVVQTTAMTGGAGAAAVTRQTAVSAVGVARAVGREAAAAGARAGSKVSGLVTRTGQVFRGSSTRAGGPGRPTHPAVQRAADSVPIGRRSPYHGCCAEVNAVSNALNAGARVRGSVVATVEAAGRRAGEVVNSCSSCTWILERLGVKSVGR
jgi:hypothetical protein